MEDKSEMSIAGVEFTGARTFLIAILLVLVSFIGYLATADAKFLEILNVVAVAYFAYKAGSK